MRKNYFAVGSAAVIALALALGLQPAGSDLISAGVMMNRTSAHQLAIACKLYAADHQGRFPMKLEELTPAYLDELGSLRWRSLSADGQPESSMNWLYFGVGFTENNHPSVLIVSPQSTATKRGPMRIVVQSDATAPAIVEETKYRELVAQTSAQRRSLRDASAH